MEGVEKINTRAIMFKVTLKIKPNGEWVDGPVRLMDGEELVEFSKSHEYFKVETVSEEDSYIHGDRDVPAAFQGFLV